MKYIKTLPYIHIDALVKYVTQLVPSAHGGAWAVFIIIVLSNLPNAALASTNKCKDNYQDLVTSSDGVLRTDDVNVPEGSIRCMKSGTGKKRHIWAEICSRGKWLRDYDHNSACETEFDDPDARHDGPFILHQSAGSPQTGSPPPQNSPHTLPAPPPQTPSPPNIDPVDGYHPESGACKVLGTC